MTCINDAYVIHRVGEPITQELISRRVAEAMAPKVLSLNLMSSYNNIFVLLYDLTNIVD